MLSARNQFPGKAVSAANGQTAARVHEDIGGGTIVHAASEAVDDLDLQPRNAVTAAVRPSGVMVGKPAIGRAGVRARGRAAAALLAALALTAPAAGQPALPGAPLAEAAPPVAIALTGQIRLPRTLTLADLRAMPSITVEVLDPASAASPCPARRCGRCYRTPARWTSRAGPPSTGIPSTGIPSTGMSCWRRAGVDAA